MTLPPDAFYTTVLPAAIGLIVGYGAGLITGIASTFRWLDRRGRTGRPMPTYTDATNPTPGHRPWLGNEHLSRFGLFLALMGTIAVLASIVSLVQDRSISRCLSDFAEASASASQARAGAGDIDRDADKRARYATQDSIDAIASLFDVPRDLNPQDRQRLTDEYKARFARNRDTLVEIDAEKIRAEQLRAANPLPPQPAC